MNKEYFIDAPEESVSGKTYFTETATPSGSSVGEIEPYYISQERFSYYRKSTTQDFTEEYELK